MGRFGYLSRLFTHITGENSLFSISVESGWKKVLVTEGALDLEARTCEGDNDDDAIFWTG